MAMIRDTAVKSVFATMPDLANPLVRLVDGGVNLGADVGGRRATLEVSAEGRGKEGAEDDLGATVIAYKH